MKDRSQFYKQPKKFGLNSIDEVKTLAEKYINEIQKEIKLCQ